jgi:F0F1-type ATP synthase membrane subunit b/b'
VTAAPTAGTPEQLRASAERMRANAEEGALRNLRAAIQTMREACGDAEAALRRPIGEAAVAVLHALASGNTNALSSVEGAFRRLQDAHEASMAGCEAQIPPRAAT